MEEMDDVLAMWEDGAAAFRRTDAYSDVNPESGLS
jgi:hypothetical protein